MAKKRIKNERPRIRTNYLAKALHRQTFASPFIRKMFREYGVPWRRRKHIYFRTCNHKGHIAQSWSKQSGHYVIELHHKIAVPDFFNVVIHEMVHVLKGMNGTTSSFDDFWDYSHDPEEHEALVWEVRYLKNQGYRRPAGPNVIKSGTWEFPMAYIDLLWEITK